MKRNSPDVSVTKVIPCTLLVLSLGTLAQAQQLQLPEGSTVIRSRYSDVNAGQDRTALAMLPPQARPRPVKATAKLVAGADVGSLSCYEANKVYVTAGTITMASAKNRGTMHISGGLIRLLQIEEEATVELTGGVVENYISVQAPATLNIRGGRFGYVNVLGKAKINIYGKNLKLSYLGVTSYGSSGPGGYYLNVFKATGTFANGRPMGDAQKPYLLLRVFSASPQPDKNPYGIRLISTRG